MVKCVNFVQLTKIPAQAISEDKKKSTSKIFLVSLFCFQSSSKHLQLLCFIIHRYWIFQAVTEKTNFHKWNYEIALFVLSATEDFLNSSQTA